MTARFVSEARRSCWSRLTTTTRSDRALATASSPRWSERWISRCGFRWAARHGCTARGACSRRASRLQSSIALILTAASSSPSRTRVAARIIGGAAQHRHLNRLCRRARGACSPGASETLSLFGACQGSARSAPQSTAKRTNGQPSSDHRSHLPASGRPRPCCRGGHGKCRHPQPGALTR